MAVYWLMLAWPAAFSFFGGGSRLGARSRLALLLLIFVFVVLIGLRTETGGDWDNYQRYTETVAYDGLWTSMSASEAGYVLVTWISAKLGWDIYGSTTFCGLVLMYGLLRFAQRQPDSWLTVTAAVPYLIIVLGMGYIRQAAALGFIMLAILDFEQNKHAKTVLYVALATLFHTSALVVIPFFGYVVSKRNPLYVLPFLLASLPALYFFWSDRYDRMVTDYMNAQYDSSGTLIRIFMDIVPSVIFLLYRRRFQLGAEMMTFWSLFAITSCLLLVAFALSPSSTVVDRLGLYLIPIQLMVFGNLPLVLSTKAADVRLINFAAIGYFGAVLFVWLHYAQNSWAWLPYRSLLTT